MTPPHPDDRDRDRDGAEVTVSGERLDVRTVREAVERVRLRRRIVTEEIQLTVAVRREELVIEREALEPPEAAGEARDDELPEGDELVLVLHAEEPVVSTRVVPVERVRVRRHEALGAATVEDTVRVEHVAIDERPPHHGG